MIQRIQTLYLFLVMLISIVMAFINQNVFAVFSTYQEFFNIFNAETYMYGLIAVLAIFSAVSYRNRNTQIRINYLSLILNILLIVIFVYYVLNLPGGVTPEKGIEAIAPLLNCILLLLANRAIKKDIELVKSVDRIR